MLYWLTQQLTSRISGFNVFSYLTFRAILATVSSLAISLLVGPGMIAKLSRYQIGQVVRDDGPNTATPVLGSATAETSATVRSAQAAQSGLSDAPKNADIAAANAQIAQAQANLQKSLQKLFKIN